VRWIFDSYLSGKSMQEIAKELTATGVTRDGESQWHHTAISYILQNERYIGDKLYQKPLLPIPCHSRTGSQQRRTDRYYIKNAPTPHYIRELLKGTGAELQNAGQYISSSSADVYPFSRIIKCGECGTLFKRKFQMGKPIGYAETIILTRTTAASPQFPNRKSTRRFTGCTTG
jgi:site-specific DNA recombinase